MSAISHITLGTNDPARAGRFYDAVLGVLGFDRLPKPPGKPPAYERDGRMPTIYLYTPEDGRPATWGNGTHVAFLADSRAQVQIKPAIAIEVDPSDPEDRPVSAEGLEKGLQGRRIGRLRDR